MKYGIVTSAGTVHDYVTMAREAEANGWGVSPLKWWGFGVR
jgi:hypothetical protein